MDIFLGIVKRICEDENVTINSEISDIGMDSIKFISVIVALEDEFEVEFEDDALLISNYCRVMDLYNYVTMLIN